MPTYDYVCDACGHAFEEYQGFTDKPLKKCPSCKKSKLRRLLGTGAAIIFKGSGFYQTDYRSESYKQAAQADKPAETTSTTGSTDKAGTDAGTAKTPEPAKAVTKSEPKSNSAGKNNKSKG